MQVVSYATILENAHKNKNAPGTKNQILIDAHDFPNNTPAPLNKTIVCPCFTFPSPILSENSKNSPASTWKTRNRASSPPPRLFRFSTRNLRAASSSTLPTFQRESKKKSPDGGSDFSVSDDPTTCRYNRRSVGMLVSPLADLLRAFKLANRDAGVVAVVVFDPVELCVLSFPQVRTLANIDFSVSVALPPPSPCCCCTRFPTLAPKGKTLTHSCSSLNRCLKQYNRPQSGHLTAGSVRVLISVLQDKCAHCSELYIVGF